MTVEGPPNYCLIINSCIYLSHFLFYFTLLSSPVFSDLSLPAHCDCPLCLKVFHRCLIILIFFMYLICMLPVPSTSMSMYLVSRFHHWFPVSFLRFLSFASPFLDCSPDLTYLVYHLYNWCSTGRNILTPELQKKPGSYAFHNATWFPAFKYMNDNPDDIIGGGIFFSSGKIVSLFTVASCSSSLRPTGGTAVKRRVFAFLHTH